MDFAATKVMQDHAQQGRRLYDALDQALEAIRQYDMAPLDLKTGQLGPPDMAGVSQPPCISAEHTRSLVREECVEGRRYEDIVRSVCSGLGDVVVAELRAAGIPIASDGLGYPTL